MSRYILSPRAQADLDEIWDYTAERWGVDQAEIFKYPAGSHVIFYRKVHADIDIVRILHGRMDFERHL